MRLILIPPYRGSGYDFKPEEETYYLDAIEFARANGQLDGVTITIDQGAHSDFKSEARDESYFDSATVSTLPRVKDAAASGNYDAIIVLGPLDIGFSTFRMVSSIPVVHYTHAALHVASMIGDRFSAIEISDPVAARTRRLAQNYGLDQKLASARYLNRSSTALSQLFRGSEAERLARDEVQKVLDDVIAQCKLAIDADGADTIVITFTPLMSLANEIRRRLDDAGYSEIQIVWGLAATFAVAKSMVELKLLPARRAYPDDSLVAKPAYR